MPDLPTVSVTQPQADRIIAAFKDKYNVSTAAEAAAAYRADVIRHVKNVVFEYERSKFLGDQEAAVQAHLDSVALELPDDLPFPDTV